MGQGGHGGAERVCVPIVVRVSLRRKGQRIASSGRGAADAGAACPAPDGSPICAFVRVSSARRQPLPAEWEAVLVAYMVRGVGVWATGLTDCPGCGVCAKTGWGVQQRRITSRQRCLSSRATVGLYFSYAGADPTGYTWCLLQAVHVRRWRARWRSSTTRPAPSAPRCSPAIYMYKAARHPTLHTPDTGAYHLASDSRSLARSSHRITPCRLRDSQPGGHREARQAAASPASPSNTRCRGSSIALHARAPIPC